MNKLILISLSTSILLGLALRAQASVIRVVTTTTDLKSITEMVGREKVKVESLGKGAQNYHFLTAKPSHMMKVKKADLFIRIGLDFEIGYESLILEGSRNRRVQIGQPGHLDASKGIPRLEIPERVDRSMGDVHPEGNPHYWLDPLSAKIIAYNIKERLSEVSPESEAFFHANLIHFNNQIDHKMEEWKELLAPYKQEKIATYHKSWIYFTERFELDISCELEPKPGVPPSPGHLKQVIDIVRLEKIKIILNENIYSLKPATFIANATNVEIVAVPISVGGDNSVKDYFALIDMIVKRIVQGFNDAKNN